MSLIFKHAINLGNTAFAAPDSIIKPSNEDQMSKHELQTAQEATNHC